MSRSARRSRGGLEREVLLCIASADGPLTAAEVQKELGGDLAYTTVMTTLSRLYEKHALQRELVGRAYVYALTGAVEDARSNVTAHKMLLLLNNGEDRMRVLARFVAGVTSQDEHWLADLLAHSRDLDKPAAGSEPATPE